MRRIICIALVLITIYNYGNTQSTTQALGASFFKENRDRLRKELPENSCAIIFAASIQIADHSCDIITAPFTQESNFFYLTGITSPKYVLAIFKEPVEIEGEKVSELLFEPNSREQMLFFGPSQKMGIGFDKVLPDKKWKTFCREYIAGEKFDKVLSLENNFSFARSTGVLADSDHLAQFFANVSPGYSIAEKNMQCYAYIVDHEPHEYAQLAQKINAQLSYFPLLKEDPILNEAAKLGSEDQLRELKKQVGGFRLDVTRLREILEGLRTIKQNAEVQVIKEASRLLGSTFKELIKYTGPGKREAQIATVGEFMVHAKGGGVSGFPKIASGESTMSMGYSQNSAIVPSKGVIEIAFGVRFKNYTCAATRTLPAGGKYEQKARAEWETLRLTHQASLQECVIGKGLAAPAQRFNAGFESKAKALGKLRSWEKGVSGIGLVACEPLAPEKGKTQFQENMVVVIESGFVNVKGKYGMEIRDVVLITAGGPVVLTQSIPSSADDIERLMAESSIFDKFGE